MVVRHKNYTVQEAAELERALEAQYQADKRQDPRLPVEREAWREIRREAAAHRLNRTRQHSA